MALSDTAIRAAKPREKQYKLHDAKGLLLIVRPTGGKLWRLKYRFAGKEQQFTIGTYPEVGLKEAREGRDAARALLAQGKDPSVEKKRDKVAAAISAGNTFKLVAEEHIAKRQREGAASATIAKANLACCRFGGHRDRMFMWPAVDREGEVLDALVQKRRNKKAALKLLRKLLKNQGHVPDEIVTDGLRSYPAAMKELGCKHLHKPGRLRDNNRV